MHRLKMEVVTAVASWALSAACFDLPISGDWLQSLYPRAQQANYNELRDQLSSNAQIIFSNQTAFAPATARWSSLDEPQPNVVVVPGTEQDVATTVLLCLLCFPRIYLPGLDWGYSRLLNTMMF